MSTILKHIGGAGLQQLLEFHEFPSCLAWGSSRAAQAGALLSSMHAEEEASESRGGRRWFTSKNTETRKWKGPIFLV
jgi:hypothetical protein